MKAHKKIRAVRALAVAGCIAGLAAPSAAMALPQPPSPMTHPNPASHAYVPATSGAKLDHRGVGATSDFSASLPSRFSLPANFRTDAQSSAGRQAPTYSLPSGFSTDAQAGAPRQTPSSAPASVIREIKTVVHDNGRTVALVLASVALGIALCGSGYAAFRLSRIQRRLVGSS